MNTSISKKLMVGIFFLPIIFAWFTLRKGVSTKARVIAFAWMVFTLILAGLGNSMPAEQPGAASPQAAMSARPQPVLTISAYKLYAAYESNTVRAESMYKGKYITITGKVGKIGRDIT